MSGTETVDDHWYDRSNPEVQGRPETGHRGGYSHARSQETMLWEGRNLHKGLFLLLEYPVFHSSLAFTCSTLSICLEVFPLRLNPEFPMEGENILHLQVFSAGGLICCHAQCVLAE